MPTLRVELLKSREEDQKKAITFQEKKEVQRNRVNMFAGYPSHATKLKYTLPELPKHRKEKPITGKSPGLLMKLPRKHVFHSPSESDSFSIKSSSSSSTKSETDSIKKPSPPTASAMVKNTSLSMSLGSYFGAQAVEMWSVTHMPPLSKGVQEKLSGEIQPLQDCSLESKFSAGNMLEKSSEKSLTQRQPELKALQCRTTEHHRNGWAVQCDKADMEPLKEDRDHGTAAPALCSATVCSQERFLETSFNSSDARPASFSGQEIKHIQSVEEFMRQYQATHGETGGVLHAEHRSFFMEEEHGGVYGRHSDPSADISQESHEKLSHGNVPFEAPISTDRVLLKAEMSSNPYQFDERPLPRHVSQGGEQDDGFSFESVPMPKGTPMLNISSCGQTSRDLSTYPEEIMAASGREASARVTVERYVVGRWPSSTQTHNGSSKPLQSSGSLAHQLDGMRKVARVMVGSLTPPPVLEVRRKPNSEEHTTPVSPLSLGDVVSYHPRVDEHNGKESVDMAWFAASKGKPPLHSPSKAHWDWRSRSIGARASLRSAVRNLEAAFGGSRSASLPKVRPQTHQREKKPEASSKFMDRFFVSPVKARHKRTEAPQPIQRSSSSGDQDPEDCSTGRRTSQYTDHNNGDLAVSSHPPSPSLHRSKHKNSEVSDFKVSRIAPLRRLPRHTSPLVSTTLASLTSQRNSTICLMQGYLRCITIDGNSCYTLSLRDSEEMLLAKACAFKHNSSVEGCKWLYTFHSGRSKSRGKGANGWRSWHKKDGKSVSDLAGKMQVSSQLCAEDSPARRRTESLVSEFVLYEERIDEAMRSQSLRLLSSNNAHTSVTQAAGSPSSVQSAYDLTQSSVPQRKKVVGIPKSPPSGKMSLKSFDSGHVMRHSPLKGTPTHQSSCSIDGRSDLDVTEPEIHHPSGLSLPFRSELAAIVIKMRTDDPAMEDHRSVRGACRRSLRFSHDKSQGSRGDPQWKTVQDAEPDSMIARAAKDGASEERPTSDCVTMMLPKEHHGVPKGGLPGATSLIERWRCGGKCDCGGWDLGCGMRVFSTHRQCGSLSMAANPCNTIQSLSHNQPLIIYSQGKTCEQLLNLSLVQEGYFLLKFRTDLSPLKAFAASVAILHSRDSLLTMRRRKLAENHADRLCETNSDLENPVFKGRKRPDFLEVCKEVPMWCHSSHPVSPYGRF